MSSEIEVIGDNKQNLEDTNASLKNETSTEAAESQSWETQQKQLQNKIAEYETALTQEKSNVALLQKDLQVRTDERDNLKNQVTKLEKDLAKNSLIGPKDQDMNADDMVTKARSMIFEKTKVCKNQELQIDALTQQVTSLKEIVSITKDMLDIRNMEVKHLQDNLSCLELKFTAEKDRHALIHAKLERMMKLNEELKTEYQKQLGLFTELQKTYKMHQNASANIASTNNASANDAPAENGESHE